MKARVFLIVVLAILIALQIGYLVKRIRTVGYSYPSQGASAGQAPTTLAGAPGGEPVRPTGMPAPGSMPSGKADPGGKMGPGAGPGPSGMPSPLPGAPAPGGPGAAPPAGPQGGPGAGAPQPGAGAAAPAGGNAPPVNVTVEMLPCAEILAGIIALQDNDKLCLSAEQKSKLGPLVKSIGEVFSKPSVSSQEVMVVMQQNLKPHQLAYIAAHRGEPPPMEVDSASAASGPGTPGVGPAAVRLLKKRAAESPTPAPTPSGSPSTANIQMMGPEDVLGGVLKLENDKSVSLTPQQAKALAQPVEAMVTANLKLNELAKAVVVILSGDQKTHILKIHDKYMTDNTRGMAPPEKVVADLQHRLQ